MGKAWIVSVREPTFLKSSTAAQTGTQFNEQIDLHFQ